MIDRLAVIQTEADRFAAVLAETPGQARIPTCPDWDAHDLLWHLTEVHLFWAGVLRSGALTEKDVEVLDAALPSRPDSLEETLALRREATADLTAALRGLSDDQARWTWWDPDQTVGFTRRMQTYEATMHRVDAGRWSGNGPESGKHFDEPRAVRAETGGPPAVVSGSAQDLALWAWGRGGKVEPEGDEQALAAMQDVLDAGIQ